MKQLLTITFLLLLTLQTQAKTTTQTYQFIYVLKVVPRLHDDSHWTEKDNKIIHEHFNHLKSAVKNKQVILAGRSLNEAKDAFGVVIFNAPNEQMARKFMQSDPAVTQGIMTGKLYPFAVALMQK